MKQQTEYELNVNGKPSKVLAYEGTALLWVLRDKLGINGPKYGCGVDVCKSCTCLVDGVKQTACSMSVQSAVGKQIITIEGLAESAQAGAKADHPISGGSDKISLHVVQKVWIEMDVAQCGFCQPGQIMAAVDLLRRVGNAPTDAQIDQHMTNVCRCGTYDRIRKAIKEAGKRLAAAGAMA
jgi:isoquinoline 1-oxidoreductase alpha subunit